ncbi:MAG: hypothetical protein ACI4IJ_05915 [Acutalibacteraceae bacterium]
MNLKKSIAIVIIFIIVVINSTLVFASSNDIDGDVEMNTGFDVEDYDKETEEYIKSSMGIKLLTTEKTGTFIDNFDVNENGDIVVAFEVVSFEVPVEKPICVYNSQGEFQYGYMVSAYGVIGAEWDGENIIIYSVRGDRLLLVDKYANVLDVKGVLLTQQSNTYANKILYSTEQIVGSDNYKLKHSKIIKIDEEGNKSVIIDKSKSYIFYNIFIILFVALLSIFVIIGLVKAFRDARYY